MKNNYILILTVLLIISCQYGFSQDFKGGIISEPIQQPALPTESKVPAEYVNPYSDIRPPNVTPGNYQDDGNQMQKSLDDFASKEASSTSKAAPQGFDNYNTSIGRLDTDTNSATLYTDATVSSISTDRFLASPCYKILGFNPTANMEEQEKRYQDCEQEKTMQQVKNIGVILGVITFFCLLVFTGVKKPNLTRIG